MSARDFEGKVAFITGAAHGQGRATAIALAKAGARIAAFDVSDLNGDDRPDIGYYGEPNELVVQFNEGEDGWSQLAIEPGEESAMADVDTVEHADGQR